ncbi:MAG: type II toxin-antitoxin system HicB family antitoxin [Bacteroidota bacterium]|nr:type II toxin-antitoxin system HicB family antitoxin [Bacteroidota bacterium]
MKLTVKISEGKHDFLIGQLKEIPTVLTQGKTIEEVKDNIMDVLELYLHDMREEKNNEKENVILEEY